MAIKDPADALEKYFELEDLSSDPVLPRLAELASTLHLPWPGEKAARKLLGRVTADRLEKIELTVKVIVDELRRHEDRLNGLRTEPERYSEWVALLNDGLKKAEQTRAKSRVERIGKILANSLTTVPFPDPDNVEEMMRVAMALSDRDIELLNELVRVQGGIMGANARVDRFQAWNSWPKGIWGEAPDGNLDSVFSKLESFGLVTRLPPGNNQNLLADIQNRYALLKKGQDFIHFVRG